MNPKKIAICSLILVVTFHAGASYARDNCILQQATKPCNASAIFSHKSVAPTDAYGYGPEKLNWEIQVTYEPKEPCALITVHVNGLEPYRRPYTKVFNDGGGRIKDNLDRNFIFRADMEDLVTDKINIATHLERQNSLKKQGLISLMGRMSIGNVTCKIHSTQEDEKERRELEEEQERQAMEEERERLEEEQRLEEERERLAMELERERLEEEQRLEDELERQRLAEELRERERRRLAQQRRVRRRLAAEQREREHQRLAQQQGEQARQIAQQEQKRRANDAMAVAGLLRGALGAAQEMKSSGNPGMAFLKGLAGGLGASGNMGVRRSPSYDRSGGGQSCEQAKRRVDRRNVQTLASLSNLRGMCVVSRGYVRMFENAKRTLAGSGCPASVARRFDQPLAQARRRVRATCP